MKQLLLTILVTLSFHSAMAADVLISTVTSDTDSFTTKLWITTNEDGSAKALKMTSDDDMEPMSFGPSTVKTGIVLKKVDSYDVVVIKSSDFEVDRGGHLSLEFLSNGITGSRNSEELQIDFDGRDWKLFYEGEVVSRFHFKGRKILGKLVGIKDIVIR